MKGTTMNNVRTIAQELNNHQNSSREVMSEFRVLDVLANMLDVARICAGRVAVFHDLCQHNVAAMVVALRTLPADQINAEIDQHQSFLNGDNKLLARWGIVARMARTLNACRCCGTNLANLFNYHDYDLEHTAQMVLIDAPASVG